MQKLNRLNIDTRKLVSDEKNKVIFSTKVYEKDFSKEFIEAAKDSNEAIVLHYCNNFPYLNYDFDTVIFLSNKLIL